MIQMNLFALQIQTHRHKKQTNGASEVEPWVLQDRDELQQRQGRMGVSAASSRCQGMRLDLDTKRSLHINQAQRTPGWRTEWSAEGQPPCAFGLGNLTHLHVSRVADRVLVFLSGVRSKPLRWESRVQDTEPPETSRPHVISISEGSPRDLCLKAKTQLHSMASKLQCWTPHANQLARKEHNPTYQQRGCLKS